MSPKSKAGNHNHSLVVSIVHHKQPLPLLQQQCQLLQQIRHDVLIDRDALLLLRDNPLSRLSSVGKLANVSLIIVPEDTTEPVEFTFEMGLQRSQLLIDSLDNGVDGRVVLLQNGCSAVGSGFANVGVRVAAVGRVGVGLETGLEDGNPLQSSLKGSIAAWLTCGTFARSRSVQVGLAVVLSVNEHCILEREVRLVMLGDGTVDRESLAIQPHRFDQSDRRARLSEVKIAREARSQVDGDFVEGFRIERVILCDLNGFANGGRPAETGHLFQTTSVLALREADALVLVAVQGVGEEVEFCCGAQCFDMLLLEHG